MMKCPVCNGQGIVIDQIGESEFGEDEDCTTCYGQGVVED